MLTIMDNNNSEDPNKLADPTTTASSLAKPLLTKPYPPLTAYHHLGATSPQPDNQEDQTEFVQISYNYRTRSFKDLPFLILFILLVLSTFGFGIFASVNRNPYYGQASIFAFNPFTSTCTLQNSTFLANPTSLEQSESNLLKSLIWSPLGFALLEDPTSKSNLLKSLIWTLVVTLLLTAPLFSIMLHLLKNYTKQIAYITLPFFVLLPVFLNVYWFTACILSSNCNEAFPFTYRILAFVFIFLIIAVIVWIIIVNWHRIELTVRIIGVSANALSHNLRLFVFLPALTVGLFLYYALIIVFLVFARLNGEIVPKEKDGHYHCVWKQDSWVPAYYALSILTMLWSATAMVEAQVYVISDTIACWYFSKEGVGRKRVIRSTLRNAFGPSSGTICMSGLLICVVRVVRCMVDIAREEDASGIVKFILQCCVNNLLAAVDFLNKFTINFAAITGEAYCTSARMTYELLKRNLLSAVFVETVSTRLLAGIIFVLSALYAIVVCAIVSALSHLGHDAYFVAVMAWLLMMLVLGFLVHVLDNVIDTVYVCYAIDRDRGEVRKQDVHDVYVHLPISRGHRATFGVRTALVA